MENYFNSIKDLVDSGKCFEVGEKYVTVGSDKEALVLLQYSYDYPFSTTTNLAFRLNFEDLSDMLFKIKKIAKDFKRDTYIKSFRFDIDIEGHSFYGLGKEIYNECSLIVGL